MVCTFLAEQEGVAQLTPMLNLPRLPLHVNVLQPNTRKVERLRRESVFVFIWFVFYFKTNIYKIFIEKKMCYEWKKSVAERAT